MSLIVCVYVEEGIVLASDSKITFNNTLNQNNTQINNIGIHTANSANKTFLCPNNTGIAACGDAAVGGKPISGFIEAFIIEKITEDTPIEKMPDLIKEYFYRLDSNLKANFIIAGYAKEKNKYVQKVYRVFTKSADIVSVDTSNQGMTWDGEIYTLIRLIQPVYLKDNDNYQELPFEGISWNFYTLQDAIDFARYAIKTTIDTMHFKTMIETVGEPIDVLVIKQDGAKWISKKDLH